MDDHVPEKLKNAAIAQLVSGLVNVFLMPFVGGLVISAVLGMCTCGFGGQLCGVVSCALVPIGIFEAIAGIMGMTQPRTSGPVMRIASYAEMASLLAGGIPSAVVGFLVFQWMKEPEVVAYLDETIIDV